MKKYIKYLLIVLFAASIQVQAQQRAVTENGEEVILHENGTWEYQNEEDLISKAIPVNHFPYVKDESATFQLKSTKISMGFWLDPKKWSFQKSKTNEDAEYSLNYKDGDLYAMIITEKVEVPLNSLKQIAVSNGRDAAPDLKVISEELRTVNGIQVLMLHMTGTIQGMKFTYFGYYYSNSSGVVQFMTMTTTNQFEEFKLECEQLLNGLTEIK